MRSAKKTVKSRKAEFANTALRQIKQTEIRKAGTKSVKGAAKSAKEKAGAATKRKADLRAAGRSADRKIAARAAAAGARKSTRVRKGQSAAPASVKSSSAAKVSATKVSATARAPKVIKSSIAVKASTAKSSAGRSSNAAKSNAARSSAAKSVGAKSVGIASSAAKSAAAAATPRTATAAKAPERRKVSDVGAVSKAAGSRRAQPANAGKAKARPGAPAVQAKVAKRPAAAAKKTKSGAIKRELAAPATARRAKAEPQVAVAAPSRPVAKKRPADDGLVRKAGAVAPEVIDLIEASKGRAATPGRAAASVNSIPAEDEQKRVAKKIEKKTPAESPVRPSANSAAEPVAAAPVVAVAAPIAVEQAPATTIAKPVKSQAAPRQGFKPNDFIVYPAHGVGQIVAIEEQEVAGFKLELYVIIFVKDKMILKVPTPKVVSVGMRKLADADVVRRALDTLTGRARIKRTMWSRRAQEYEAKINSGDLISIAEVVRDLYRSDAQPEQSYSERQLYEAALDRMAREVVIVQKLTETETLKAIEAQLQKGPRRGKAEEIEADDAEADIEEAA